MNTVQLDRINLFISCESCIFIKMNVKINQNLYCNKSNLLDGWSKYYTNVCFKVYFFYLCKQMLSVESKHLNICNAWNRFAFPSENMLKRHPTQKTPIHVHLYETNVKKGTISFPKRVHFGVRSMEYVWNDSQVHLYYSMCLCICIKMWCSSNSNGNGNRKLMTNWFYGGNFLFAIVI